jgi:hypothetical protein
MPGWINMPIKVETRQRLDTVKRDKAQSYNALINELLDELGEYRLKHPLHILTPTAEVSHDK